MTNPDPILSATIEISRAAGNILLKGFRSSSQEVSYKSRTNLVTNFDLESEKFIVGEISKRFPEHSIVAEEGSSKTGGEEFRWYIDPLDATNNFAHGIPFFCVSIGVFHVGDNSMYCGAVYDPVHDEMFHALKGKGAQLNGKPIGVSSIQDLGISLLATGFPYCKDDMERNNLKNFNKFLPNVQGIRRMGSAALDLCSLAVGRIDGYWEPMLKPWDVAAGSLIVSEAGGVVTKFDGSDFDPEVPEILASNGKLHSIMKSILAQEDKSL